MRLSWYRMVISINDDAAFGRNENQERNATGHVRVIDVQLESGFGDGVLFKWHDCPGVLLHLCEGLAVDLFLLTVRLMLAPIHIIPLPRVTCLNQAPNPS